jgi:P4 family phage/plasmid primase-like protien
MIPQNLKLEINTKTQEFLKLFPHTLFCYIPDHNSERPVIHSEILDLERQREGYGIFFTINGFTGGKRDGEHLISVNALYCDIDYPDKVNKTPDKIRVFKNELIMELAETDLIPTAMVETKNGLHVYWVFEQPIMLDQLNPEQRDKLFLQYRQVEERILTKFDGDPGAKDLSRVLRVPQTFHQKDENDPYEVKLIHFNIEMKYSFATLRERFLAKDAPDAWAEVNVETGITPEVKKDIEKNYPKLERPSFKKLLDKQAEIPEGMRNKALLIAAYACKDAGWSIDQTYEYFGDDYHGLSLHEIRKTIRSAFEHNYDFGYNNEVMQAVVPAEERQRLSEVTSEVLSKKGKIQAEDNKNRQKEVFLTYELVVAQRYPNLKYKIHGDYYDYKDGVYVPMQADEIRSIFLRQMLEDGLTNYRKVSAVNDKLACFKSIEGRTFRHTDENPDRNLLNFANGLLNIETYEMLPHTPEYLSTSQIPIFYNKDAKAPRWEKFLDEIMDGDHGQVKLLQQIAGYCLTMDTSFAKAFVLFGSGGNGKSLFTRLITKLVGSSAVGHLNLTDISRQFGLTGLVNRKINVIDEISGNYFESNVIKNIISGEPMMIDVKFRPEPLEFTPVAKVIFSVNELPKINDTTPGLYRRFILVPFNRTFIGKADTDLERKLDAELPGILNWAVEGLRSLRHEGQFAETDVNKEVLKIFKMENSPLLEMLEHFYEPANGNDADLYTIPVMEMYTQYRNYCMESGYKPKSTANFLRELINARYEGWKIEKVETGRKVLIKGIKKTTEMSGLPYQHPADKPHESF